MRNWQLEASMTLLVWMHLIKSKNAINGHFLSIFFIFFAVTYKNCGNKLKMSLNNIYFF